MYATRLTPSSHMSSAEITGRDQGCAAITQRRSRSHHSIVICCTYATLHCIAYPTTFYDLALHAPLHRDLPLARRRARRRDPRKVAPRLRDRDGVVRHPIRRSALHHSKRNRPTARPRRRGGTRWASGNARFERAFYKGGVWGVEGRVAGDRGVGSTGFL